MRCSLNGDKTSKFVLGVAFFCISRTNGSGPLNGARDRRISVQRPLPISLNVTMPDGVFGTHRILRDLKPKLEQFAVDARRSPERVLNAHTPDQRAEVRLEVVFIVIAVGAGRGLSLCRRDGRTARSGASSRCKHYEYKKCKASKGAGDRRSPTANRGDGEHNRQGLDRFDKVNSGTLP